MPLRAFWPICGPGKNCRSRRPFLFVLRTLASPGVSNPFHIRRGRPPLRSLPLGAPWLARQVIFFHLLTCSTVQMFCSSAPVVRSVIYETLTIRDCYNFLPMLSFFNLATRGRVFSCPTRQSSPLRTLQTARNFNHGFRGLTLIKFCRMGEKRGEESTLKSEDFCLDFGEGYSPQHNKRILVSA